VTVSTGPHPPAASSAPASLPAPRESSGARASGGRPEGGAAIRIRLLGRFAVDRDGQEIVLREFGGSLARRLLRLLALRRGTLAPKDVIAGALWPDNPPADPAGNIEVLVSRLRRALGDRTLIRSGPGGYVLADGGRCWVDAEAFLDAVQAGRSGLTIRPAGALTSFRAALGIWRGEPLPEDTYADWAQADRRHLALAYLEALDGAAAAALDSPATATAAEAASWARQAVAAEPLREPSVLLLVRALAATGDQAGALASYDEYRDRLTAETGLDPTPQARQARQRILAGQPAGGQPHHHRLARPGGSPGPSADRADPFLGREEECAVIAGAAAGLGPRAVLVTGPGNVGKSALLAEAARRAGVPVLAAQAFVPDQDQAWSLAGRLLSQAARRLPVPVPALLTEPEASALAEVAPGLAWVPDAAPGGLDDHDRRAFALQAAVRLIAATARPRCLIVADDLHWADPASLTLLGLLLRRLDGVSLAAAYRPDASHGFDPAEALGLPASQTARITLGPLPARVIRGLFSDQPLAEAIIRQAGHTPFTVTEVTAALARQGAITRDGDRKWRLRPGRDATGVAQVAASGVERAAGNRLAGLPSRWRDMLGTLALLGRPAPPALLAAAAGTDLRTVLDTLEGLGSAGMASPGPQGWAPGHKLVRQAVTAAMHPTETARGHALLARALRQCGADPAEVASHLAASGDNDGAARAYAAAARRHLDRVCDREAMRLAGTGLSLDPGGSRAVLLEVRGEARRRLGQLAAARADFTAALENLDTPADRSRVLAQLAILDARTADAARGAELAELAIAEAGDEPAALGQALAAGAIIDLAGGNLARARYRARRAARLLDQAGDSRGSARLLYWRAMACFIEGRLPDAAGQLDRLANLGVTPGEVLRLWSPRATRGHALAFLGRAADGLKEIEEALARARAACHPAVEAECLWHRAEALAALGRPGEAVESAEESAGIAARIGHAEWTAASHRGLGIACEAAGLPGRAESAYRRSLEAAQGFPLFRAWAAARLGAFLARQGRPDEAMPHVQAALSGGPPLSGHEARWAHAELLASQGSTAACRAAAATALDQARDGGYLVLAPRLRELARC
jgi:DNA-binding SARP family transcriptional activator/tetratricopeptide (TPR) repeat protein